MKKAIAIIMAVFMLTGLFTACSGTVGMDDGRAYGNVSTTPNGRVNGGDYNDNYRNNSTYNTNRNSYQNYDSNSVYGSGTGMTGGR